MDTKPTEPPTRGALPMIYIAGPFRGPTPLDVRRNIEHARDIGLAVAQAGGYPMIPHTMTSEFDKQLTDEFWLQGSLQMLMVCDGICLSPRWESSSGARAELDWALAHHLPHIIHNTAHGDGAAYMRLERWIAGIVASGALVVDALRWQRAEHS